MVDVHFNIFVEADVQKVGQVITVGLKEQAIEVDIDLVEKVHNDIRDLSQDGLQAVDSTGDKVYNLPNQEIKVVKVICKGQKKIGLGQEGHAFTITVVLINGNIMMEDDNNDNKKTIKR